MYDDLESYLSKDRLRKYLELTGGDKVESMRLYEVNLKHSSQMYLILSCFEVILRNTINNTLIDKLNANCIAEINILHNNIIKNLKNINSINALIDCKRLFTIQEQLIVNTTKDLERDKKPLNTSYYVSRMNFSFWENLFSKNYESVLWNKYLSKIFKNNGRGHILKEINSFRRLRNRIAHSECLRGYNLVFYYDSILNFLDLINIKLRPWIEKQLSRDLFR
ncbi:MAG: hypothetical protein LBS34_03200 [Rickettsiales bacterium]|jgi:hypothetical protein|nr:hypothetical protein [Rickettsiales bacterium]